MGKAGRRRCKSGAVTGRHRGKSVEIAPRSSAQNKARYACGRITILLDVRTDLCQAQLDGTCDLGARLIDSRRPLMGKALGLELGVKLVAIELSGCAVR